MKRTAQRIEESKEARASVSKSKRGKGASENKRKTGAKGFQPGNRFGNRFQPGQSGNPGGRPKNDVAREIAKAIFEDNAEAIYRALLKAILKGNAYTYKELADRAYGRIKETVRHEGELNLAENLQQARRRIGELSARIASDPAHPLHEDFRKIWAEKPRSGEQSDGSKKV